MRSRWTRTVWIGAGVGLALGMPLFEVFLLTALAIDGEWFDAAYTIRYFSESANLIILLAILHIIMAMAGALAAALWHRARRRRRRFRVIHGGAGR